MLIGTIGVVISEDNARPVTKCVCKCVSFAELKIAGIASLEEAAERFGCGQGCGSCKPYIAEMLETGDTAFPVLPL